MSWQRSFGSTRIGTRLLMYLLPTVALIMAGYAGVALREQQRLLAPVARQEAHAYANVLALTFAASLREVDQQGILATLNRLSLAPQIFGVKIYDSTGASWFASALLDSLPSPPNEALAAALAADSAIAFDRDLTGQTTVSILQAIRNRRGGVVGVLEVAESPDYLISVQATVRRRFAIATFTLLAGVALVTLWLVRRVVTAPLDRLLSATRSLGRGNLTTRVPESVGRGEIGTLAREFNGMAMNLESARVALVQENDERILLERRLRGSEHLASIGRLAAGLAHEVAAPLNVISGRAEMLLAKTGSATPDGRNLRIIVDQIRRITGIVRNLLDFARRPELARRRLDLVVVIDGVLDFLEAELLATNVAVVRPTGVPLWIDGDPDQLHQVFINLLLNGIQAVEHLEGKRELRVDARFEHVEGEATPTGTIAHVTITDSGPGIAPDLLPRIFDPFVTTKPSGTGLGLVVARSIIEAHGGRVDVENGPSGGARFSIRLPAAPLHETVYA